MKCIFDDKTKNISSVLDAVWPIGSIYLSVDATNPSEKLGGTWEVFAQGQMLLGFSATHKIGSTGGEETHKLTISEMPSHSHRYNYHSSYTTSDYAGANGKGEVYTATTESTGGSQPHNNMPPFITVGIWRRIA